MVQAHDAVQGNGQVTLFLVAIHLANIVTLLRLHVMISQSVYSINLISSKMANIGRPNKILWLVHVKCAYILNCVT